MYLTVTHQAAKPEVKAFIQFILDNNQKVVYGSGRRPADR